MIFSSDADGSVFGCFTAVFSGAVTMFGPLLIWTAESMCSTVSETSLVIGDDALALSRSLAGQ